MAVHSINLLKNPQKSLVDKSISWALTIGRFLVILTETIALITFASRFSLDRQLVNLHDEIKRDQQYIQAFSQSEANFRRLQDRLAAAKQLNDTSKDKVKMLTEVVNIVKTITSEINQISLTDNAIRIDCNVNSIAAATSVVNAIKENKNLTNISIDKIENKSSLGFIAINISASLKQDK